MKMSWMALIVFSVMCPTPNAWADKPPPPYFQPFREVKNAVPPKGTGQLTHLSITAPDATVISAVLLIDGGVACNLQGTVTQNKHGAASLEGLLNTRPVCPIGVEAPEVSKTHKLELKGRYRSPDDQWHELNLSITQKFAGMTHLTIQITPDGGVELLFAP